MMAYSGVYVIGDSLVDSGNALKLAQWYGSLPFTDLPDGAPTASLGYFQGRFSDGYTFADLIANKSVGAVTSPVFPYDFDDPWLGIPLDPFASDPTGKSLNFAYGGSQIRNGDEVVPDLDKQTDAFRDAVDHNADPNALVLITMGGNDVRSLVPSGSSPASVSTAHSALDKCADQLLHELGQLIDDGVHNILITGIPDVGLIPRYDINDNGVLDGLELQRSAAATEYSQYLDTLIRTEVVPALQARGATITYVPLMNYTDAFGHEVTGALAANLPTIAALHGLTAAELEQNLLQHQDLLFFDDVHPNAQAHALLGAYLNAQLTGAPWIENLPLTGADVDYRANGSIGAVGEIDKIVVSLVAGTTYTFEMLGVSSLGFGLADSNLRLLTSRGVVAATDDDSGAGFDARISFTAATSGTYTLELSAIGMLTGAYTLQAAVAGGAAMQAGNTYTVNDALTVVLEGAGGLGTDVVKAGVSYALSAFSEIEVLRTTNDKGKTAINLTGNDFDQTIVGNAGNNIIEGKGGADVMTGGAGRDTFVLSPAAIAHPGSANIDHITDYASGDVVDISQMLSVAAGTNVLAGGYVRVTTSGLIQVDVDGGGNNWVTLSTVNGNGAVAVRYLSGGIAASVSVTRVAETQLSSMAAAGATAALTGAVAASGLQSNPAGSEPHGGSHPLVVAADAGTSAAISLVAHSIDLPDRFALTNESHDVVPVRSDAALFGSLLHLSDAPLVHADVSATPMMPVMPAELLAGTDMPHGQAEFVAASIAMSIPPADGEGPAKNSGEVQRVLADALHGGVGERSIDELLHALPASGPTEVAVLHVPTEAMFMPAHLAFTLDALIVHQDAVPLS
jgi:phospholipase/lecithinase/hemolysin